MEQVAAERAVGHHPLERPVGRGDDPDVGLALALAADPGDRLVLQEAQQPDLVAEVEIAELVEEEGAALGLGDAARPVDRTGEGAADRAHQLGLEQLRLDRADVDRDERPLGRAGVLVDVARHHLLADPGLAEQQDALVAVRRELADLAEDPLQGRARDQAGGIRLALQERVAEPLVLASAALVEDREERGRELVGERLEGALLVVAEAARPAEPIDVADRQELAAEQDRHRHVARDPLVGDGVARRQRPRLFDVVADQRLPAAPDVAEDPARDVGEVGAARRLAAQVEGERPAGGAAVVRHQGAARRLDLLHDPVHQRRRLVLGRQLRRLVDERAELTGQARRRRRRRLRRGARGAQHRDRGELLAEHLERPLARPDDDRLAAVVALQEELPARPAPGADAVAEERRADHLEAALQAVDQERQVLVAAVGRRQQPAAARCPQPVADGHAGPSLGDG